MPIPAEALLLPDATLKLPTEILCYIFEEYLQQQFLPIESTTWYSTEAGYVRFFRATEAGVPLGLGAVCRRWRQAAWGHPRLWTTLAIRLDAREKFPFAHINGPELISQWFQRAGSLPLHIRLRDCGKPRNVGFQTAINVETSKAVVRIIRAYSARWFSLDFDDVSYDVLNELHAGTDNDGLSILQTIVLNANVNVGYVPTHFWEGFSTRHHPAHVSFAGVYSPFVFDIDWANVTHAYADGMSSFDAPQAFLESCAMSPITHLVLYCFCGDEYPQVEFKHLTHLSIISPDDAEIGLRGSLFHALTAPALKNLRYDEFEDTIAPVFPTDAFCGFLQRSCCNIEEFTFMSPSVDDAELIQILQSMPSLTRLALWFRESNDSTMLFNTLSPAYVNPTGSKFLPLLNRLELTARAPRPWSALTKVFERDPPVPGHPRTALRQNLIITCQLIKEPDGHVPYIERGDLFQLIELWVTLRCLIHVDDDFDPIWTGDQHIFSILGARVFSEGDPAEQNFWSEQMKVILPIHRQLWGWLQEDGVLPIPLPDFNLLPHWRM